MRRIRQPIPDATLLRLIRPTTAAESRPDKAFTPHPATMPDATLLRLIRPTTTAESRPDKAFTPHPA
ncbi:hypothetical protein DMI69_02240 [Escherichia coli]|nr:hypothetical protein [Escherichia coli]